MTEKSPQPQLGTPAEHTKPPHTLYYEDDDRYDFQTLFCNNDPQAVIADQASAVCIHCHEKRQAATPGQDATHGNYVCNAEIYPTQVVFDNGRTVMIISRDDGSGLPCLAISPKSDYPKPCGICDGVIQSQADLDWHGYGNCRDIPDIVMANLNIAELLRDLRGHVAGELGERLDKAVASLAAPNREAGQDAPVEATTAMRERARKFMEGERGWTLGDDDELRLTEDLAAFADSQTSALREEIARLRLRLFHYNPDFKGKSHTTACSIWREDGQGHADGFDGDMGPCNCGALVNFYQGNVAELQSSLALVTAERDALRAGHDEICELCRYPRGAHWQGLDPWCPSKIKFSQEFKFALAPSPAPSATPNSKESQ